MTCLLLTNSKTVTILTVYFPKQKVSEIIISPKE